MASEAERVGLNQERARARSQILNHLGEGSGDFLGIAAIQTPALDAVARGPLPQLRVRRVLLADGGGVGIAVVFDDENDRLMAVCCCLCCLAQAGLQGS